MEPLSKDSYAGIIRKVDDLGRIVLPMEIRKSYNINTGTKLEIMSCGPDGIFLRPKVKKCAFCFTTDEDKLMPNGERSVCICKDCLTMFNCQEPKP